jgi:hypothetical protein
MDRYKYSVTPFSPIKELIPGKSIRAPFSADLSMDEVFMCMKHGPVYRLFPGKDPIRVTGSNLPSLHRAKFEEELRMQKSSNKSKTSSNTSNSKIYNYDEDTSEDLTQDEEAITSNNSNNKQNADTTEDVKINDVDDSNLNNFNFLDRFKK